MVYFRAPLKPGAEASLRLQHDELDTAVWLTEKDLQCIFDNRNQADESGADDGTAAGKINAVEVDLESVELT